MRSGTARGSAEEVTAAFEEAPAAEVADREKTGEGRRERERETEREEEEEEQIRRVIARRTTQYRQTNHLRYGALKDRFERCSKCIS